MDGYAQAFEALRRKLEEVGLRGRSRYNVELVFEEIVTNIIRHGEVEHEQPAVEVALGFARDAVVMRFHDDGAPFDPREHAVPDTPGSLEDARIGGLGIKLVRHVSTHIDYERTPEARNRLTVTIPAAA
jgi:anti-sigma regulatory factor (Ser/Thr protein kinase)